MKSGWFWFLFWVLLTVLNGMFAVDGKIGNLIAMAFAAAAAGFQFRDRCE